MRIKKYRLLGIAALATFFIGVAASAATPSASSWESLPESFYQLPEDHPERREVTNPATENRGMQAMVRSLDQIFAADLDALDRLNDPEPGPDNRRAGQPDDFPDMTRWHLRSLMLELGISFKGIMAPLSLKGTIAMQVYWRKKMDQELRDAANRLALQDTAEVENQDKTPVAISINQYTTRDEMLRQLEPTIKAVMATGKVKDEDALRDNLSDSASEFFELARAVPEQNGKWWASRLRVDVWIDVEGKVHPEISVGAEIKLRFEWFRLQAKNGRTMAAVQEPRSEQQEKFNQFVRETSDDAREVSYETFHKSGFYPNTIRLGIGVTASGNFGVVKFGGGLMGYLYLSTSPPGRGGNEKVDSQGPASSAPLLLIENDPRPEHLTYARQEGIPFEVTSGSRGFIKQIVYKIERGRFRKGLMRSVKLSSRMAERAAKPNSRKWRIHEIRPSFELSIGGDFKLVSIAGAANLEMSFINGNF